MLKYKLIKLNKHSILLSILISSQIFLSNELVGQSISHNIASLNSLKECGDSSKNENFSRCHFKSGYFEGRQFYDLANFDSTVFDQYANFEEINAFKGITFKYATFHKDFSIYRMEILTTDFDSAIFKGEARFERLGFSKLVNFSNCTFESKVSFRDVDINTADFSHLHLTEQTEFAFHETSAKRLDFSFNPKIYNEIRLIDAFDSDVSPNDTINRPPPCLINLYKSDISKFYLDYYNFKLWFPEYFDYFTNDSTNITQYEKQVIYESLLNNFKNHDQLDSYKLLDIEYQNFKYDNSNHPIYKWIDHYWWNFGYNKEYIFYWTFSFLLFFTCINFFIIENLNKNIYLIESMPRRLPIYGPFNTAKEIWMNCKITWTRFWFALVYTTAIFFKVTIKIENFKFRHKLGTAYLFIIYITGLICLGYMANLVLQK